MIVAHGGKHSVHNEQRICLQCLEQVTQCTELLVTLQEALHQGCQ
jgi:hypothetical protein